MDVTGEGAGGVRCSFLFGRQTPELADVFPILIENHDPMVSLAIGDVQLAGGSIVRHPDRLIEQFMTGIQRLALDGSIRGVELQLLPDVHEQFAVRRVLLDDGVILSGDEKVPVAIKDTAVNTGWNGLRISEGTNLLHSASYWITGGP